MGKNGQITISRICKAFGDQEVLRDFSAVIPADRITCIMGQSGCGKTTLLQLLMGLEKADSGEITGMPEHFSAVFQEDRLCEDFSAAANLRLARPGKIRDSEIRTCLSSLGIDVPDQKVSELSGGMKRRVAIARALLAGGELLLMDEPFKGLDDETKKSVIKTVKDCGIPAIIITHDPEDPVLLGADLIQMT